MSTRVIKVNDRLHEVEAAPETPLLWVLRDALGLKGTKFGCGIGVCGACTVHIDGEAVRACVMPLGALTSESVTTIEGLASTGPEPESMHPVQEAWLAEQVPQCGFCQPGMIMAASALLARDPDPDDKTIDEQITNVCRCGTYPRIRRAIRLAAGRREAS